MYGYPGNTAYSGTPVNYGAPGAGNVGGQQSDLQQLGTAATAYANSHYSLVASAYAQYGQAAQQAAHMPTAAAYGGMADYSDPSKYQYPSYSDYANAFKSTTGMATGYRGAASGTAQDSKTNSSGAMNAAQSSGHFQGFEASVKAAATSYLEAKNAGKVNSWMGQKKYDGGRGFGGSKKRFGLGHSGAANVQHYFCDTCKVSCPGTQAWQAHLEGKPHKKKEEAAKKAEKNGGTVAVGGNQGRGAPGYRCEVCEVTLSSRDTYDAHMKGKNHTKKIQLLLKLNKPIPAIVDPPAPIPTVGGPTKKVIGVTGTKFVGGAKLVTTGAGAMELSLNPETEEDNNNQGVEVKPVGEEFIVQDIEPGTGKFLKYRCKLCDCEISDVNAKNVHLKGKRHRLQYKQKVDPTLDVDVKQNQWQKGRGQGNNNNNIPKLAQIGGKGGGQRQAAPMMQQLRPLFPMPRAPVEQDDRHVVEKVHQIELSQEEQIALERLVEMVERTLKAVSDAMATEGKTPESGAGEAGAGNAAPTAENKERMLKGVMRVGYLAKNLLLKSDKQVDLVVLCAETPTRSLLTKIVGLFTKNAQVPEGDALEVVAKPELSALLVGLSSVPQKCAVTLSCVALRDQEGGTGSVVAVAPTAQQQPTKPDQLPLAPCLAALAELRHAKFYQVRCAPLHSVNTTMKIARDICSRVITWSQISPWALELLVEKTLASLAMPLSPGDAIRRLFEVIASGILVSTSTRNGGCFKLMDPCEKEPTDVLGNLPAQSREDLTSSAQHALRLITYKQIHKILSIKRLQEPRRRDSTVAAGGNNPGGVQVVKRPAPGSENLADNGCSDPKMAKKDEPMEVGVGGSALKAP